MDTPMDTEHADSDSTSGSSEPEIDINIITDMLSMSIPHCTRSPSSSSLESSTPPSPITPHTRIGEETTIVPPRTHNGRQRLRPFLITLIDSGKVKGLEWMNKEKTLFKIPWKHAGKQDYNPEEDSKIFKLWSTNTGKYKEGVHVPEPAVWKTRLRTALNKLPDIEEIQEKTQLDIPEPYRVYKLHPKKSKFPAGPRGRTTSYPGQDHSASYSQIHQQHQINHQAPMSAPPGVNLYQSRGNRYDLTNQAMYDRSAYYGHGHEIPTGYGYNYGHSYRQESALDMALNDVEHVIQQNDHPSPTPSPQFTGHDMTSCSPPAGAMYPSHHPDVTGGGHDETATKIAEAMMTNNNDPAQINNYHDLLPQTTADIYPATTYGNPTYTTCTPVTMSTNTMTTVDHHQRAHEPMDASCRSQENRQSELPSEHSMTIQVYYRSLQALSRQVENTSGCMLYSKQPWDEGIHLGMDAIQLPDISDIIDPHSAGGDRTIELTNEVLQCFQKGISIQFKNGGDVYVTRRCRSVVFWSIATGGADEPQRHEKLERDVETKVFDLQEFRDRMREYLTGSCKSPQIPQIYFTVAQKWGPESSLHSCLVSIVVTPSRAAVELRSINHDIKTPPVSFHKDMLCFSGPDVPTPPNYTWGGAELASHSPYYNSTPPTQVFAACMT